MHEPDDTGRFGGLSCSLPQDMDVVVALVSGGLAIIGLLVGHWLGRRHARQDRLRALYADVLHAAIRITPRSFGYRVGPEDMNPSDDEVNLIRARLSVESQADENDMMQALVGVHIFSGLYKAEYEHHKADPDAVPREELDKTEKCVRDAMDLMQTTARKRLFVADRLVPELRWPSRKASNASKK